MQPLHDQQHSDAGAVRVGVVDHGAVQVDEPLVLGQRPVATHMQRRREENKKISVIKQSPSVILRSQYINVSVSRLSTLRQPQRRFYKVLHSSGLWQLEQTSINETPKCSTC